MGNNNLRLLRKCGVRLNSGVTGSGLFLSPHSARLSLVGWRARTMRRFYDSSLENAAKEQAEERCLACLRREACGEVAPVAVLRCSSCAAAAFVLFVSASHCFAFDSNARCCPSALQTPIRRTVNSLDLALLRILHCCY